MAKKKVSHFIGLNLGEYTIIVNNAREIYGHDDSLPYNAEFVVSIKGKEVFSGRAWNDGWGGPSNYSIDSNNEEAHNVINSIDKYGAEHLKYTFGSYEFSLNFMDIIDYLVDFSVDGNSSNCGHIFTERALVKYLNNINKN